MIILEKNRFILVSPFPGAENLRWTMFNVVVIFHQKCWFCHPKSDNRICAGNQRFSEEFCFHAHHRRLWICEVSSAKICKTPPTWFPIEKKRCNKATCLFQVSITTVEAFSMVMHFIHKRCLVAASQTLRSCFTVPDGCERATGNFHCKQCYLLMYNMRLQIKINNNKSGFKQV